MELVVGHGNLRGLQHRIGKAESAECARFRDEWLDCEKVLPEEIREFRFKWSFGYCSAIGLE